MCKTCRESRDTAELGFLAEDSSPTSLGFSNGLDVCSASSLEKLHGEISAVSRRVDDRQNSLFMKSQQLIDQLLTSVPLLSKEATEVSAYTLHTGVSNTSKPPSLAEIVSKDLEKIVKSTVVDTFNMQRNNDRRKLYVAIYGMPEEGRDYSDVIDMIAYLRCESLVIACERIGREQRSSDQGKPRPLKVELSAAGKDYVLKMSHVLNDDAY